MESARRSAGQAGVRPWRKEVARRRRDRPRLSGGRSTPEDGVVAERPREYGHGYTRPVAEFHPTMVH
jgi:hypothetical protein